MQVKELRAIRSLNRLHLIAGESGLQNEMHEVVILEYENLKNQSAGYYAGDFIISSLVFAKDSPELIFSTIRRLILLGAAGIAVKTVYFPTLPPQALRLAEKNHFPVFLFHDIYIENVILSITDYMKEQQNFSEYEQELHRVMTQNLSRQQAKTLCAAANPQFSHWMSAAYFTQRSGQGEHLLRQILASLQLRPQNRLLSHFRFLQYSGGAFVIDNAAQSAPPAELKAHFSSLLLSLGLQPETVYLGVSSTHSSAEEFAQCLRESYYACLHSVICQSGSSTYSELGLYRFLFPALQDTSALQAFHQLLHTLKEYDRQTGACLMVTLRTYAAVGCSIPATAKQLCQHPNTIRYRLRHIQELLSEGQSCPLPPDALICWTAGMLEAEAAQQSLE